jgi:hypothetical protein
MSETNPHHSHEHLGSHSPEMGEQHADNKPESFEHRQSHEQHKQVEEIQNDIEKQKPLESTELLSKLNQVEEERPIMPANNELKRIALNNYLSQIRSNLSGSAKQFSKFIHQPKINAISEVTGKTIVRPTAILFAGIFMFLGSSVYLYATYHTNAKYNFFVALFLFFGGFIAGLIIELFYKLFFKRDF